MSALPSLPHIIVTHHRRASSSCIIATHHRRASSSRIIATHHRRASSSRIIAVHHRRASSSRITAVQHRRVFLHACHTHVVCMCRASQRTFGMTPSSAALRRRLPRLLSEINSPSASVTETKPVVPSSAGKHAQQVLATRRKGAAKARSEPPRAFSLPAWSASEREPGWLDLPATPFNGAVRCRVRSGWHGMVGCGIALNSDSGSMVLTSATVSWNCRCEDSLM